MDDLDDVIGILNSNRQNKAKAASFIIAPGATTTVINQTVKQVSKEN